MSGLSQWFDPSRDRGTTPRRGDGPDRDDEVLVRAALLAALCVFLASTLPHELFAAGLQSLFWFAGMGTVAVAAFRGESLDPPRWTYWDAGAAFYGASILLSWLVDEEAVRAALAAS